MKIKDSFKTKPFHLAAEVPLTVLQILESQRSLFLDIFSCEIWRVTLGLEIIPNIWLFISMNVCGKNDKCKSHFPVPLIVNIIRWLLGWILLESLENYKSMMMYLNLMHKNDCMIFFFPHTRLWILKRSRHENKIHKKGKIYDLTLFSPSEMSLEIGMGT